MRDAYGMMVLDTLEELIDPRWTALLVIDVQNDFCHPDGHFSRHGADLSAIESALPRMRHLVIEARKLGIPIFLIQQQTLPNGTSDSPAWRRFKTRDSRSPYYATPGSWGCQFDDGIEFSPNDIVIVKFRPDAFLATHLDQFLRARGIKSVVVTGMFTEGCVESTVRAASYHDYYVVVAQDAVASTNKTLHEGSMRLFKARYPLADTKDILNVWSHNA